MAILLVIIKAQWCIQIPHTGDTESLGVCGQKNNYATKLLLPISFLQHFFFIHFYSSLTFCWPFKKKNGGMREAGAGGIGRKKSLKKCTGWHDIFPLTLQLME